MNLKERGITIGDLLLAVIFVTALVITVKVTSNVLKEKDNKALFYFPNMKLVTNSEELDKV